MRRLPIVDQQACDRADAPNTMTEQDKRHMRNWLQATMDTLLAGENVSGDGI